jgi:hypothetical protein
MTSEKILLTLSRWVRLLLAPFARPRLVREIEAAIAGVDRLRKEIGEQGLGWDGDQRPLIAQEFYALLGFISKEGLLEGTATAHLSQSASAIKNWAEDKETSNTTAGLVFNRIEQALLSRLWILGVKSKRLSSGFDVSPETKQAPEQASPPQPGAPGGGHSQIAPERSTSEQPPATPATAAYTPERGRTAW